jgi:hypothetical protein
MLNETVSFLKKHGKVILLRMPTNTKIRKIENEFWKNFDDELKKIATNQSIQYINYKNSKNQFYLFDGIHFDLPTTERFTKSLCDSINSN